MPERIHSWVDGYIAARRRAVETCGAADEATNRWPRTTGADAIAIASLLDPAIRAHGTPGVARRWFATLNDLQGHAIHWPHETYAENRLFWSSFESAAIFLDDVAAMPPEPEIWDALLAQLGAVSHGRNAVQPELGPFARFEGAKTYDELWLAQRTYLADKRGSDVVSPPTGFGVTPSAVPRTTNADVMQLATYWSERLASTKHEMGHDGVVAMWQDALADVDKLAKPGMPDYVYAKNTAFWASSWKVAVQVAVSEGVPSTWDMVVSSVRASLPSLPENLGKAASVGVSVVADAAQAVGTVVNEAGKGLFKGLSTPLLIGAGLLGAFVLARRPHHEAA